MNSMPAGVRLPPSARTAMNALMAANTTPRPTASRHRLANISRSGWRVSRAHADEQPHDRRHVHRVVEVALEPELVGQDERDEERAAMPPTSQAR